MRSPPRPHRQCLRNLSFLCLSNYATSNMLGWCDTALEGDSMTFPKYCPTTLQNTEGALNHISYRRVLHIKVLICSGWGISSTTPLLQGVPLSSVLGKKSLSVQITRITQIIISCYENQCFMRFEYVSKERRGQMKNCKYPLALGVCFIMQGHPVESASLLRILPNYTKSPLMSQTSSTFVTISPLHVLNIGQSIAGTLTFMYIMSNTLRQFCKFKQTRLHQQHVLIHDIQITSIVPTSKHFQR